MFDIKLIPSKNALQMSQKRPRVLFRPEVYIHRMQFIRVLRLVSRIQCWEMPCRGILHGTYIDEQRA